MMKAKSVLARRISRLRDGIRAMDIGGAVVVPGPNMKYFTGVDSLMLERPFMLIVPAEGEAHLVAPTLEAGPYRDPSLQITLHQWTDSEGPREAISKAAKEAGMKGRWGIEGRAPFSYLDRLTKEAPIEPVDAEPLLQGLREEKDGDEAKLLKKAGAVLSRAFEKFPELLRAGATEIETARSVSDMIFAEGATTVDDVLVQSGAKSADPHHLPSAKRLARGDAVVIDVGATYLGYFADVTRTFCVGSSLELEKVYAKVLEAQGAAIGAAGPGVRVGAVDAAARDMMSRAGMGRNFFHRTGHGLGLEIHEAPYIVEGGEEKLLPGMCFTVEPGAYFRGRLGVRIEDDVLVEAKAAKTITDAPREYGWWR